MPPCTPFRFQPTHLLSRPPYQSRCRSFPVAENGGVGRDRGSGGFLPFHYVCTGFFDWRIQ